MDNLSDDIIKYKNGELTPAQMHALEKKALSDPFLADALEGVDTISAVALMNDVSAINEKISKKKIAIRLTPLRIAAGIAFLVASVFVVYQFRPKPDTLALKKEEPKPEIKSDEEKQDAAAGGDNKKRTEQEGVKEKIASKNLPVQSSPPASKSLKPSGPETDLAADKVQKSETADQRAVSESHQPIQQALVVAEEPAKIEGVDDQKTKEQVSPAQTAAGAQSITRAKKKEAFSAGEVQRTAVPSAKMQITKSVSGQVVSSEDGSPLPGVNVTLKGTTLGAVTDANGFYTIRADGNNSLVFSFIGFQPQEVDASGKEKVDVQMKDDASQLSEVVVTGYGVAKADDREPVIRRAEPLGGLKAYDNYLESNLQYPEEALKNKIKGKSGVEFTVGTDGSLSEFRVFKKLGYGCEEEIIRLVKEGPKWTPTTEDSKPVESTVRVRMRFDPAKAGK